jgi:hypothetical protein
MLPPHIGEKDPVDAGLRPPYAWYHKKEKKKENSKGSQDSVLARPEGARIIKPL